MWFLFALATFCCWGIADLFYKKGNTKEDEKSHYTTGMIVGIIMGIHATFYFFIVKPEVLIIDVLKYLPISLCYISSMIIGYKGLQYIDLSISSPIQNSSGVITSLLLVILFATTLSGLEWFGIFFIGTGVFLLSMLEKNEKRRNGTFLSILFPLFYALLDGTGTFLDCIYLDYKGIVSEEAALISYEYTFFIYAIIIFMVLYRKKKRKFSLKIEKDKVLAAILETGGQFFYVFAIASNSVLATPIIASYSILSIILSRIFLKEKLTRQQYVTIAFILIGIGILGISS